jgi:hypothetical protein
MRILHVLSQLPDATGSGFYVQAMMRHSIENGHSNGLLAALDVGGDVVPTPESVSHAEWTSFVRFREV